MAAELTPILPTQVTANEGGNTSKELSPQQITALSGLLAGRTAAEAAEKAGVGRTTIYKWLRTDFAFQAALNRYRRDLQQSVTFRLEQLAVDSADCVGRAVRQGDVKAALEILKGLNVLTPSKIGSDDRMVLKIEHEKRMKDQAERIALHEPARQQLPASGHSPTNE